MRAGRAGGSLSPCHFQEGSDCKCIISRASSEISPTVSACPRSPTQLVCGWKLCFPCTPVNFISCYFSPPAAYTNPLQRPQLIPGLYRGSGQHLQPSSGAQLVKELGAGHSVPQRGRAAQIPACKGYHTCPGCGRTRRAPPELLAAWQAAEGAWAAAGGCWRVQAAARARRGTRAHRQRHGHTCACTAPCPETLGCKGRAGRPSEGAP